jgi:hypothetical protein
MAGAISNQASESVRVPDGVRDQLAGGRGHVCWTAQVIAVKVATYLLTGAHRLLSPEALECSLQGRRVCLSRVGRQTRVWIVAVRDQIIQVGHQPVGR